MRNARSDEDELHAPGAARPRSAATRASEDGRLLAEHRQKLLLETLAQAGAVTITRLSRQFRVSRETVRRDLAVLDKQGRLRRTHGGAISLTPVEPDESQRELVNVEEKRAIGNAAAKLVSDGMSVILDSGTTTRQVADALVGKRNLTIYTNDLGVCRRLGRRNGNKVVLLGGVLQDHENAVLGPDTTAMLSQYFADFAFVGVGGITTDGVLTDYSREASDLRGRMLLAARSTAVVADHTKFGRTTPVRVPNFEKVAYVITDRAPEDRIKRRLVAKHIKILIAKRSRS